MEYEKVIIVKTKNKKETAIVKKKFPDVRADCYGSKCTFYVPYTMFNVKVIEKLIGKKDGGQLNWQERTAYTRKVLGSSPRSLI